MKKLLLTAVACAAASIVGFLVLEAVCRVRGVGALQRNGDDSGLHCRPSQFRPSRNLLLGWEFNPELYPRNCAGFKVNSMGILGREYPHEKDRNTFRILVIGDSITEQGWYVARLERLLNSAGLPLNYEVWNCGVPGYSVWQYYFYMAEKSARFHPDMIIIGFCLNDLNDMPIVSRDAGGNYTAYVNPVQGRRSTHLNILLNRKLFFSSYAYRYLLCGLYGLKTWGRDEAYVSSDQAIGSICRYATQHSIKLCPVIFPYLKSRYNADEQRQYDWLRGILDRRRVPFLDLHGAIPDIDNVVWRSNGPDDYIHPSERGHRIAAEKIFNYLMNDRERWLEMTH